MIGRQGIEIWTSDGDPDNPAGTHMVKEIYPGESLPRGPNSAVPAAFAVLNGVLYFTAQSAEGRGLWTTDGTDAGTVLVKSVSPLADSLPMALTPAGGLLFFVADDGVAGRELWRSDGTFDGTFLVGDICNVYENPAPLACGPFVVAGTRHDSSWSGTSSRGPSFTITGSRPSRTAALRASSARSTGPCTSAPTTGCPQFRQTRFFDPSSGPLRASLDLGVA